MLGDPTPNLKQRDHVEAPGSGPIGVRVTWSDPAGREFSILSGIEGEIGSSDVLAPLDVRDRVATVSRNSDTQTYFAIWHESPEGSPCSQYAAIGTGLSEDEFRTYVGRIR